MTTQDDGGRGMRGIMSPLRQYEVAKEARARCVNAPGCPCVRDLRAARRRLTLSAIAYMVVAVGIVGVAYVLIVVLWAGFGSVGES